MQVNLESKDMKRKRFLPERDRGGRDFKLRAFSLDYTWYSVLE